MCSACQRVRRNVFRFQLCCGRSRLMHTSIDGPGTSIQLPIHRQSRRALSDARSRERERERGSEIDRAQTYHPQDRHTSHSTIDGYLWLCLRLGRTQTLAHLETRRTGKTSCKPFAVCYTLKSLVLRKHSSAAPSSAELFKAKFKWPRRTHTHDRHE